MGKTTDEEISKDFMPDMPADARRVALEESAYRKEQANIDRPFTEEEMSSFKDELSENSIKVVDISVEKKAATANFDAQLKPLK